MRRCATSGGSAPLELAGGDEIGMGGEPVGEAADGGVAAGEGAAGQRAAVLVVRGGLDGLEQPGRKAGLDGGELRVGGAELVVRMDSGAHVQAARMCSTGRRLKWSALNLRAVAVRPMG